MKAPDADRLFRALDATWPAARIVAAGPWLVRQGLEGGQRVSAATAAGPVRDTDIPRPEATQASFGPDPIFMIRPGEADLDGWLGLRGYRIVDPVTVYLMRASDLAEPPGPARVFLGWPPLAIGVELWAERGIGAGRIAVMERATGPKTALLGRAKDRPAAMAFLACDGDVAMLHALEVIPEAQRTGLGTATMRAAAHWAMRNGAIWLAVLVTDANAPGNGLYRKLGMTPVTRYHYRRTAGPRP